MKSIYIRAVSVMEVNEWLVDAIETAEGHDRDVIGTIGIMLEDFSGFIHDDPKRKSEFMDYLQAIEEDDEVIH